MLIESILSEWFERDAQAVATPLDNSTGLSGALIWKVELPRETYCLKRWPQNQLAQEELTKRHDLLRHVSLVGFPQVPLATPTRRHETSVLSDGHLWDLTTWMPGKPLDRFSPSTIGVGTALQCLANFHRAAATYREPLHAPSPGLQVRRDIARDLQDNGLTTLRDAIKASPPSDLRTDSLEVWSHLERNISRVNELLVETATEPLPQQWCLRDVKYDHVLFQDEKATGIIDFGAAAVDSVAGDIARLLGSFTELPLHHWQSGMDAYHACRPLSVEERRVIESFDKGGVVASAANWLRWLYVEQRNFPNTKQVASQLRWLTDRLNTFS